jgi:membrane associated rhomboid family serine protease
MTARKKDDQKKTGVAMAMAVSGIELALYIIVPIGVGYLVGKGFGNIGAVAGLFTGAVLGLVLAVMRAIRMTL